jgi:hypothetical protein
LALAIVPAVIPVGRNVIGDYSTVIAYFFVRVTPLAKAPPKKLMFLYAIEQRGRPRKSLVYQAKPGGSNLPLT